MIFKPTKLKEVFEIELELKGDDRGYFMRNFAVEEFKAHGINAHIVHINRGFNKTKGTIRGFHYQTAPKAEDKILQALSGAFYDIVVDLRRDSSTYKEWQGFEISAEKKNMLVVPKGCAHGIQTLTDNCEMQYLVTEYYSPEHERGIRWNDPGFDFKWPLGSPIVISDKDANWPDFTG
ncbi:MAG: dTDP-4-dehydrorhamnose 3,5-epimerase [Parcubacteria group bacterium GW2011_GWA2_51_10]|nr:MAG: dTDP-4-dehydrorhamnose 3,5-epimerase [Parcubacteria group bacterium GW2011_GWA2_51_10]